MRPFCIPGKSLWLDLDTVQELFEPTFLDMMGSGGFFIELQWHHAFRDERSRCLWNVEWRTKDSKFNPPPADWKPVSTHDRFFVSYEGDEIAMLTQVRREVFVPFWEAWTGRRYG